MLSVLRLAIAALFQGPMSALTCTAERNSHESPGALMKEMDIVILRLCLAHACFVFADIS